MKKVNTHGHGDHYVHIKITIPKSLSKKQKALLQAYAELEENTPGQIYGVTYDTNGKGNNSKIEDEKVFHENQDNTEFDIKRVSKAEGLFHTIFDAYINNQQNFALGLLTVFIFVGLYYVGDISSNLSPGYETKELDWVEKDFKMEKRKEKKVELHDV